MSTPKISIIIPIYNVEKYLDKCVQCARHQTLQDIEIILVDDESPDGCPQMCDEYATQDSRIKVVHKKNGGLGFARNSGLEVATGEYVTFLDSDDFVDLYTYEHLYNIAKKRNLDAVYYKFKRFVNEDEVKQEPPCNEITICENDGVKELMLDIISSEPSAKVDHKIHCSSCTSMYRFEIIEKNNVRFHSERELISEDLIFNLDFLKYAKKVAFNNGAHYHYRVNPTSLTSTIRTDRIEKNFILYEYINNHLHFWQLEKSKGQERNARFFIGNSRSSIKHLLKSDFSDKSQWLKKNLSLPIWKELYQTYKWKELPQYSKVFFYLCYKRYISLLFILCKLK